MKLLKIAIKNKFDELTSGSHNAVYNSVSGQLYFDRAKQNATLPYIVYHIISGVPDYTFTSDFENRRIQFDIHSDAESSTVADDIYTNLKALFDWCSLTVTGYSHVYMRRILERAGRDPVDDVWTINADYEILIEKN